MIQIWGFPIPEECLSVIEMDYLNTLPKTLPPIEWVWAEMDKIWQSYHLDNTRPLFSQPIDQFYKHPVWLMNGIFSAVDPISESHRQSIAIHLSSQYHLKNIADYGGGCGALARAIVNDNKQTNVSIIEPYPSSMLLNMVDNEPRIKVVSALPTNFYDAVIAQDVLEHVEDPVFLAFELAQAVKAGGKLIIANCFYPVIHCHLPAAFHLRHTFRFMMQAMGLEYAGFVEGAPHAKIYMNTGINDFAKARRAEALSKIFGPMINKLRFIISQMISFKSNSRIVPFGKTP